MGHGEGEAATGPQHPLRLTDRTRGVLHELEGTERGERHVEGVVGEREARRGSRHGGHPDPGLVVDADTVLQLSPREIDPHRRHASGGEPPGALGGTAADLEHAQAGVAQPVEIAEDACRLLVDSLG